MTQEVRVTITLEVDVTRSKEDIQEFVKNMVSKATFKSDFYDSSGEIKIEEEAEIYGND